MDYTPMFNTTAEKLAEFLNANVSGNEQDIVPCFSAKDKFLGQIFGVRRKGIYQVSDENDSHVRKVADIWHKIGRVRIDSKTGEDCIVHPEEFRVRINVPLYLEVRTISPQTIRLAYDGEYGKIETLASLDFAYERGIWKLNPRHREEPKSEKRSLFGQVLSLD